MNTSPLIALSNRLRPTPFTSRVLEQGAKAFTVYNHMLLPTEFASVEEDYWQLCEHVQVWDVGVERQVSLRGADAQKLVQWMTPRDISATPVGKCVYVPLADEQGMLINDPVGLKIAEDHWWLSIADSDVLLWAKGLATGAQLDVVVEEPNVWPVAVQGPKSDALMRKVFGDGVLDIRFFRFQAMSFNGHEFNVARSGWSKQGGYEIYVDNADVGRALYDTLFEVGAEFEVRAGCPNLIERIESGLLSFGNDMTSAHTVLECGLGSFINLDAEVTSLSIEALREQNNRGFDRKLCGVAFSSSKAATPFATDKHTNIMLTEDNQQLGRLGSQVWSPKHKLQLATVMLEKPFFEKQDLRIQLQDGTAVTAHVLDIPFDFTDSRLKA